MVRIALIDECEHAEEIGQALASAGYDVTHAPDSDALDSGGHIVVRVTLERSRSGIATLAPSTTIPADEPRRAEAEARLHEAQKLEAIARLAGGIAHDFNNVLSVISICTDEAIEATDPGGSTRACLDDIRDAVDRGSSVTRDLLAFSRRDMQHPQLVDFNDVLLSSKQALERAVGDAIRVETTLAADELTVRIDASQWSSVFANLAQNARTAMPAGGSLTLRARAVTVDPAERGRDKPKGDYVELEVTDTGCGMPHDVKARIFEPFFTTKGLGRATGLGLSVVFGVVEQSGGWIEVVSEVGAGTTFRIYVPCAVGSSGAESHSRPTLPQAREVSVLVVEDEEPMLRIAVRALSRSGYRVLPAASAEEALAKIAEVGNVDALVTDLVLPGLDGRRLAEMLTARDPTLAVLYTSGYTDDEVVRRGVSRSELFFLQKPYSTKALVQRVEDVLAATKAKRALMP
ncbi:MAG: response regulator [Labilithrix sp.]|nr:response regulator [Labilithrix sp.]